MQASVILLEYVRTTEALYPLHGNLTIMQNSTNNLVNLTNELDAKLNVIYFDIYDSLLKCYNESICEEAMSYLGLLTVNATYNNLTDLNPTIDLVETAIAANLTEQAYAALEEYENLEQTIEGALESSTNGTKETILNAETSVNETYDKLRQKVDDVSFSNVYTTLADVESQVANYSIYIIAPLAVAASVFLVIVVLIYLGLGLGWHGSKKANKCSFHGANILLASVIMTLIMSWTITIYTTVTFVAGGVSENFACRPLVGETKLAQNFLNDLLQKVSGENITIDVGLLLDSCEHDKSIYESLSILQSKFDINSLLDLDEVYEWYSRVINETVENFNISLITEDTNTTLYALDSQLSSIDFNSYYYALQQPITNIDLELYALMLNYTSTVINETYPDLAANLTHLANELRLIDEDLVTTIENERTALYNATLSTESLVNSLDFSGMADNVTQLQNNINTQLAPIVDQSINNYSTHILHYVEDAAVNVEKAIRNDIGNCRPLYEALVETVHSSCVYLLGSFNGLWFCFGWLIAFALPASIIAMCLSRMFRAEFAFNVEEKAKSALNTSEEKEDVVTEQQFDEQKTEEMEQDVMLDEVKEEELDDISQVEMKEKLDEIVEQRERTYSPVEKLLAFLLNRPARYGGRVSPSVSDTWANRRRQVTPPIALWTPTPQKD